MLFSSRLSKLGVPSKSDTVLEDCCVMMGGRTQVMDSICSVTRPTQPHRFTAGSPGEKKAFKSCRWLGTNPRCPREWFLDVTGVDVVTQTDKANHENDDGSSKKQVDRPAAPCGYAVEKSWAFTSPAVISGCPWMSYNTRFVIYRLSTAPIKICLA